MKHQLNQVRIIAGKWRGRRIAFPNVSDLRPTPDRVRETLFNWLSTVVVSANCLDLFAGSGALSFEALSRGAASVVAVEKNPEAISAITASAKGLSIDENTFEIAAQDALLWLQQAKPTPVDIVFLDPPYSLGLLPACIQALSENKWLKPKAWVYFEDKKPFDEQLLPKAWQLIKSKRAGHVYYYLAYQGM